MWMSGTPDTLHQAMLDARETERILRRDPHENNEGEDEHATVSFFTLARQNNTDRKNVKERQKTTHRAAGGKLTPP